MEHGGPLEKEGRVMSQVHVGGVDLCDNLPNPVALTAQTQNLNEANTLTQTQSLPPSQNEEGGRCGFIQKPSPNNNGKEEVEQGKERGTGQSREEDEDDDTDEVMKEEEEEEGSEESSSFIRCQSPDTPMTDSSYSETGSLLETSCPFSPGTSPVPTSPVIPVVSPMELSQYGAEVDSYVSNTGSGASNTGSVTCTHGPTFTMGPLDSTSQAVSSTMWTTSPVGSACITEATDSTAKNTDSTTEPLTSSTELVYSCQPTCTQGSASSYAGSVTSMAEPLTFTTEPTVTGTESTFTSGPVSSNWEHITSTSLTTGSSVSTCATGSIPSLALLESLEQLAQRGDDTNLPQYLHQIAEAFVLQEDYQRALWCIQLERLYHQRVLDNLNALQEQWESQSRRTSSDLATQQLDTLKHICQTHSRPRTRDAECASVDILRPKFEECGVQHLCTSANQVEGGMEQSVKDSSCPVIPSVNFPERLNSPESSEKDRKDPGSLHGSRLTDKQVSDREEGEAEVGVGHTISVIGNGLHPSTAGGMDQSMPAEQQGQDLDSAQEKEEKTEEERNVEEAEEALEMEDEGEEEEEEEKQKERDSYFCQKALPVETVVSGAEVEVQPLHQDALAQKKLHEETQESIKTCLHQEADLHQEANMNQQEQQEEEKEEEIEEEEEEYEVDQADIIREASSLDDMAKLITVEEMSPASGLVSILKKRSVCMDNVSMSARLESRTEKPTAKRRVHFKVPDDSYEQDVGGGDSCLLLFLLCLVTVVISVGGTALYCAFGDAQSSVCQDFSRNADFYFDQIQRGISQIQHWLAPGS